MKKLFAWVISIVVLLLVGTSVLFFAQSEAITTAADQIFGPNPVLPAPHYTLIPTVNIAPASPWPEGIKPIAAKGLTVNEFAGGLDHPRWMFVLPNGDILVAETNAPAQPDNNTGLKGWVMGKVMARAGAGAPSANRITLLRDSDKNGTAKLKNVFLSGLNSPFGMALIGDTLYVADTDAIMAFPYVSGATSISDKGQKLVYLPAGPINHHWTKDLIASPDGKKLYATVGSNSNVAENGIEAEANRASVLEVDVATKTTRVFADGLRNPNGLSWNPETGELWVAVNERDELGNNLVPDYMTSVKDGAFYGWPYSYFGQNVDVRVKPPRPDLVAKAIIPDYALGAHTASLGLTFNHSDALGPEWRNGAFIGQHGSWNRKPHSGYKVIFVPFANGKPNGQPQDVLTGFLSSTENAMGRPVGVAIDNNGSLLVADDVGNRIWRVSKSTVQVDMTH